VKVLLVTADYPPDVNGVGDYTKRLKEVLSCETHVLTNDYAASACDDEHRIIRDWTTGGLTEALEVCDGFDIVHVQYPGVACGRGMLLNHLPRALGKRCKTVATFHEWRSMRTRWRVRATLLTRGLDAAVAVDAEDAKPLRQWSRLVRPLSAVKPITIPIAPNVVTLATTAEDRDERRRELGLQPDEKAVAFFGLIYPHKGVADLLDAAGQAELRPIIIGDFDRDASWRPTLQQRLEREAIWVRGADAAEVSRTLHACDVAALPYESGAGPNRSALLTCLSHGLPTVTTNGPTTSANFAACDHLTFVPPKDVGALADALVELRDRPGNLGERASAWAASLSWPAVAAKHVELYEHLLS
jgi:glycosyltransferase involved in cell wall biosynthesis